jgi:hypothetical protein
MIYRKLRKCCTSWASIGHNSAVGGTAQRTSSPPLAHRLSGVAAESGQLAFRIPRRAASCDGTCGKWYVDSSRNSPEFMPEFIELRPWNGRTRPLNTFPRCGRYPIMLHEMGKKGWETSRNATGLSGSIAAGWARYVLDPQCIASSAPGHHSCAFLRGYHSQTWKSRPLNCKGFSGNSQT